jgi:hypothetical protein
VDDKVFWGLDALPMMRACIDADQWFDGPWQAAGQIRQGVIRQTA